MMGPLRNCLGKAVGDIKDEDNEETISGTRQSQSHATSKSLTAHPTSGMHHKAEHGYS